MELTKKLCIILYLLFSFFPLNICVLEIPLKPIVVKGIPKYKNISVVEPGKNIVFNNTTMLYEQGSSYINSELLFLVNIKIGSNSQPFNLILDTGSSALWVAQRGCGGSHRITNFYNPSSSTSSQRTTIPMEIQYGTGYTRGIYYNDKVEYLKGKKFNIYFGLASTANFDVTGADGIIGLSKSYDDEIFSFIHMLKNAGNTDSLVFSIKFENDYFQSGVTGTMYIGEHDDFSKSGVITVPLTFYGNKIFWASTLNSLSLKSESYETKSSYETKIIFDTGTNSIILPFQYLKDIEDDLEDFGCEPYKSSLSSTSYTIRCKAKNDLPDLHFNIDGNTFIIPKNYAFYYSAQGGTNFVYAMITFEESKSIYIIGSVFFFVFHTLFDEEGKVLKFYPLKGSINNGLSTFVIVLIVTLVLVIVVGLSIIIYKSFSRWKKSKNNLVKANLTPNYYENFFTK